MSRSDEALVRGLSPLCRELGVRLYDAELVSGTLGVTVEAEGGLDLDALSEVAQRVSAFLDDHDELAPKGRYELEVGTPGLERRLRTPAHLAGAVGERVAARLRPGVEGARRLEGRLESADAGRLVLSLDDGTRVEVAIDDLERVRTVFDWRSAFAADKQDRRAVPAADGESRRKVARS